MSLQKRIQIILSFLVFIPLLLLFYQSYKSSHHSLLQQIQQGSFQIAQLETAEMDRIFDPARFIVEGLIRALETTPSLEGESIRELMHRTLVQTPEIYGVAVAFEPESTPLGPFAPYFYRPDGAEKERSLVDSSMNYIQRDWYRLSMESQTGIWTKPYFDEGGGDTLMITFAAPIRREGRLVGVAEVDLDLAGLVGRLQQLKPGGDGTVYLVNRSGQILAHPAINPTAALETDHDMGPLAELMSRSGVDTMETIDPVTHLSSWVLELPIPALSAARGGQDWSLIVSWPLSTRLAPLSGLGRKMLVLYLFLGGASILFLNRSFDRTITRPLRQLAGRARRYAEGDFRQPPAKCDDTLELRELSLALDSLGAAIAKSALPVRGETGKNA